MVAPILAGGGTRIKALEALAAARPVVGTTVAVERIGFEHDRHGLIGDDAEALAEATMRVLLDDEVAGRYARNARTLAERYRWATVTKPLAEIYGDLIEHRAPFSHWGEKAAVDAAPALADRREGLSLTGPTRASGPADGGAAFQLVAH